jgi:hypothetical protein
LWKIDAEDLFPVGQWVSAFDSHYPLIVGKFRIDFRGKNLYVKFKLAARRANFNEGDLGNRRISELFQRGIVLVRI